MFTRSTLLLTIIAALFALVAGCSDRTAEEPAAPPATDASKESAPAFPLEGRFAKPLIIGSDAAYPPMEFVEKKTGQVIGFDVDMIREIGRAGGFTPEVRNVDWKAIFGALENGEIDAIISSVTITEERRQKYDFSEPYMAAAQRIVTRRGEARTFAQPADFEGATIGGQIGTTGLIVIEKEHPKARITAYDSMPLAFADLENGKLDGVVVDEPVALEYTKLVPENADKFSMAAFNYADEYYGVVVRKGDTDLLQRVNAGLKAVKEAGIDSDLQKKWLE